MAVSLSGGQLFLHHGHGGDPAQLADIHKAHGHHQSRAAEEQAHSGEEANVHLCKMLGHGKQRDHQHAVDGAGDDSHDQPDAGLDIYAQEGQGDPCLPETVSRAQGLGTHEGDPLHKAPDKCGQQE